MSPKSLAMGAIIVAVAMTGPVGFAMPAYAHNVVIDQSPKNGEILTALPESFFITTNEPMLELGDSNGFAIQIQDAAGAFYGDGCLEVVDATMSTAAALGAPGDYTMRWQAVSADGHTIDGTIPFTWQPAGTVDAAPGSDTAPVCGQSVTPEPSETASPPTATETPVAEAPTASGIDLATVLWVGGALLAAGIAVAVAIVIAGRRKA